MLCVGLRKMCLTCPTGPNLIAFYTKLNVKRKHFILRWKFLAIYTTLLIRMDTTDI